MKAGIQTNEGDVAVKDAIDFLEKVTPLKALDSDESLNSIAKDSVNNIGLCKDFDEIEKKNDLDSLIEKYGSINGAFAQSVEFGTTVPEMIVANLLIDDGDSDRGNRKNIFKEEFKIIGANYAVHKEFRTSTVILFCQNFIPNKDGEKKTHKKADKTVTLKEGDPDPSEIKDEDFTEGVTKVSKEVEIITKGKQVTKIVTTNKTMKDGSIVTEVTNYEMEK